MAQPPNILKELEECKKYVDNNRLMLEEIVREYPFNFKEIFYEKIKHRRKKEGENSLPPSPMFYPHINYIFYLITKTRNIFSSEEYSDILNLYEKLDVFNKGKIKNGWYILYRILKHLKIHSEKNLESECVNGFLKNQNHMELLKLFCDGFFKDKNI